MRVCAGIGKCTLTTCCHYQRDNYTCRHIMLSKHNVKVWQTAGFHGIYYIIICIWLIYMTQWCSLNDLSYALQKKLELNFIKKLGVFGRNQLWAIEVKWSEVTINNYIGMSLFKMIGRAFVRSGFDSIRYGSRYSPTITGLLEHL